MLKSFRYLLFPFALLYGAVILLRNWMFDKNILKSASFSFPVICVGNLATGGTGKTPMTEYLVEMLQNNFQVATLSRGYKRKTKGFAIADAAATAIDIGDEPMQFHLKFPNLTVAVGEERLVAIPQLLHERPATEVIILDDAFQHRSVKAGLNILLTEYKNLYTRDLMAPSGDLRDVRRSAKRADIILVTKCKPDLSIKEKEVIAGEINPLPHQAVFFSEIVYGEPYHLFNNSKTNIDAATDCLLVCGIANPKPLMEFLTKHVKSYDMLRYADHHIFSTDDLKDIQKQFKKLVSGRKLVLTTEKDAVRLHKYKSDLIEFPIYVMPIRHRFLFDEAEKFGRIVLDAVNKYANSATGITVD